MTVVLGMHSLDEGGEQIIAAEALFRHEEYGNLTYLDNDIMLIKLEVCIAWDCLRFCPKTPLETENVYSWVL